MFNVDMRTVAMLIGLAVQVFSDTRLTATDGIVFMSKKVIIGKPNSFVTLEYTKRKYSSISH